MFKYIADLVTYDLLRITAESHLGEAVHFFIYDTLKISILIFIVITIISFFRTYFDPIKVKKIVSKARFRSGNLIASVFGALTPFCSCSSIPLFIGFIKARIPIGIAFSFLITSPLVNEVAFVIMGGLFGWKIAVLYAVTGILLGVILGLIIGASGFESEILLEDRNGEISVKAMPKEFNNRLKYAFKESKKTLKKLIIYIILGMAIGAGIHGYVPQDFFMNYVGQYNYLAVPLAVILGVPIYAGCSTLAPIIFSITANGVPLGTSLAFMMSIAGLSLPEAMILKRILSLKLLAVFFGLVALGIILVGYLFNLLQYVII